MIERVSLLVGSGPRNGVICLRSCTLNSKRCSVSLAYFYIHVSAATALVYFESNVDSDMDWTGCFLFSDGCRTPSATSAGSMA